MNFYDFSAKTMSGKEVSMSDYTGKVVVVVNTASKCGLVGQLGELEELFQKYKDSGVVVLGFPCAQFADQELDSNEKISEFCSVNYGVTFTMFEKIDVNGENAHEIFKYLTSELKGVLGSNIKWNFTKFVIAQDGNAFKRFAPTTKPKDMYATIDSLLNM